MAKRDFDKELDVYLSARNKGKSFSFDNVKKFVSNLIPKKDESVEVPDDVEVYCENTESVEEVESKEPWIKRIFSNRKAEESEDIEYKLLAEDAVSDLKFVTKVALEAIRNMPSDKLKNFRQSEDFDCLKKILKKHELIK